MKAVIRTFTGKQIDLFKFNAMDIDFDDIAHGLALVPRFAGQTRYPISIAQHSIYVAKLVAHLPVEYQMQALLHDASEAYVGDVTKWLKETPAMEGYRDLEFHIQNEIYRLAGVPTHLHKDIELADRIMVRYEGRCVYGFGPEFAIDHPNYPPLTDDEISRIGHWSPMDWRSAEMSFRDAYRGLLIQVMGGSNVGKRHF